jgi:hypothetical protein
MPQRSARRDSGALVSTHGPIGPIFQVSLIARLNQRQTSPCSSCLLILTWKVMANLEPEGDLNLILGNPAERL